ncbi:hypothetical protein DRH29_02970 [candidate division Kazan bacterium]|uniref:DUF3784 domain-containing protein n=1 Tax=candidate division Kazan bacterium TaxID=2202143 RepID=A0A420ZCJ7_UNCK3|nr:MAG: hypothetical protein DRH29_02970 [candidate division Kazan bacterium]
MIFTTLIIAGAIVLMIGVFISITPGYTIERLNLPDKIDESTITYVGYILGVIGLIVILLSIRALNGK